MESDQENGQRVGKPCGGIRSQCLGVERPVGQGEPQVSCHQRCGQVLAMLVRTARHDRDWLHAGDIQTIELLKHLVFPNSECFCCFLDRHDVVTQVDKAHDVSRNTLGKGSNCFLGPGLQGGVPRKFEELRSHLRCGDGQRRAHTSPFTTVGSPALTGDPTEPGR